MSTHDPAERVEHDPRERVPAKSDEQTVREYLEGVSGHDLTVLDRLAGDERLIQADGILRSAFPDYQFDVDDLRRDGDRVVARFMIRGTHLGPFHGVAETRRTISAPGTASFRVEAGRIVDAVMEIDDAEILRQLGHPEVLTGGEPRAA